MCSPHSLQHVLDRAFCKRELLCILGAQHHIRCIPMSPSRASARSVSESMRTPILSLGATSKQLSEIAKAHPAVAIGSSPSFDPQHGLNTNVVLRVCDAQKLTQAKHEIEGMLERVRRAQSSS